MRFIPRNLFIQNFDGDMLREIFLISSITTIFFIRFFLSITDYPQLSGAGLHIAHLLWGGFFMAAALFLVFSFLGKRVMGVASILGGIGFGAFIDELGKFITSDNNYFYQPTFAILYVIFVLIYVLSRLISKRMPRSAEYTINAIELTKDVVINDLDEDEKKRVLEYLSKSDQKDPLVIALKSLIRMLDSVPVPKKSLLVHARDFIKSIYLRGSRSAILHKFFIVLIGLQLVLTLGAMVIFRDNADQLSFTETGKIFSSGVALTLVILGILSSSRSKILAYRFFKGSILVMLLVTQLFTFYENPLSAVLAILYNMLLLQMVDYVISNQEKA